MSFSLVGGVLHADRVPLPVIAGEVGTPVYVYSAGALRAAARTFREAMAVVPGAQLAFAVKANPNLAVLRILAEEGYGADIVSGGELIRATAARIAPAAILFSGVGKSRVELAQALDAGVGQINIEHEVEGMGLAALARARGCRATTVLRVNPDVEAGTHAKISTGARGAKFGVAIEDAPAVYARLAAEQGLNLRGVAVHIGSQLTSLAPMEAAFARVGALVASLRAAGHTITHVDLGGGLGIAYRPGEVVPSVAAYAALVARATRGWGVMLQFEPGRFIAAAAGVLLTEVLWVKPTPVATFVIVDAGMNDLARPALYDAWHDFAAVRPSGEQMVASIAGPVCETGDTFARDRAIDAVAPGDLAVFRMAGAYGASMASTYNCRARVPEVLVDGARWAVVSERESPADALARQRLPAWMSAPAPQRRVA